MIIAMVFETLTSLNLYLIHYFENLKAKLLQCNRNKILKTEIRIKYNVGSFIINWVEGFWYIEKQMKKL